MLRYFFIIITMLVCLSGLGFAEKPILKLVYKDIGKPPYMQVNPDSSGLYYDIMKRAVEKIGFKLVVLRLPKKRTYKLLETGKADLYASAVFKDYRSEFLYYFPNGLYRHEIYYGLTSIDIPEITSILEINKYNLVWFVELGSSNVLEAQKTGVNYFETSDVRIDRALKVISGKRRCFYRVLKTDLDRYRDKKKNISLKELGVRLHKKCFKSLEKPLYTAFSRSSPYYSEQPNLFYDKTKPVSVDNFPVEPVTGSVPYNLKKALQEMINSGEISHFQQKYTIN